MLTFARANVIMDDLVIHQHPPTNLCATKRLLVIHDRRSDFFEGTGSIIKSLMINLAEAIHSDRILVWGNYVPPYYSRARNISCYNRRQGGLYDCFFEHISSCTLSHATDAELRSLASDGYNASNRIVLAQSRRGIGLYVPPPQYRDIPDIRTMWPAVLAAYVFRRKIATKLPYNKPMYCAHIRHGDVKALENVYKNRRIYTFDAYTEALKAMGGMPETIFISTDAVDLNSRLHDLKLAYCTLNKNCPIFATTNRFRTKFGSHIVAARGGCNEKVCGLPADEVLKLFAAEKAQQKAAVDSILAKSGSKNSIEMSNVFGSAVKSITNVVSGALPTNAEPMDFSEYSGISHSEYLDIFRTASEAVADLDILSQCDAIVGTGTSHFSTLAILLSWYNRYYKSEEVEKVCGDNFGAECVSGSGVNISNYVLLDVKEITTGEFESSFLLGTYATQEYIPPERGFERWASLEQRFRDDINFDKKKKSPLVGDGNLLGMPKYPYKLFDDKVVTWWKIGDLRDLKCNSKSSLEDLINDPVDMIDFHPNRALRCWKMALAVTSIPEYIDVIEGNMLTVQKKEFWVYRSDVVVYMSYGVI
jgi:hypothetical protein